MWQPDYNCIPVGPKPQHADTTCVHKTKPPLPPAILLPLLLTATHESALPAPRLSSESLLPHHALNPPTTLGMHTQPLATRGKFSKIANRACSPAGTVSWMRLVSRSRPSPPQRSQATKLCPWPSQRLQVVTCWKAPRGVLTAYSMTRRRRSIRDRVSIV